MELSIVIPVYNEEANLGPLLEDLAAAGEGLGCEWEAIAVDDGSVDGSARVLRELARRHANLKVIEHGANRGMGAALLTGSRAARGTYVIWIMADRSDRLADIVKIHAALINGLDLAIASRAVPDGDYGELGGFKAFLSWAFSQTARLWFGVPAHDLTNAFRGIRRDLLDRLDLKSADFAISPELAIRAHRAGARVGEVPTTYRFRREGHSSFRVLTMGVRYSLLLFLKFSPATRVRLPDR